MILCGTSFNKVSSDEKLNEPLIPGFFFSQQAPFFFLKPVPATIKLRGKIDLSFFRNRLIVSQYRYRLAIPGGGETVIDRKLINWSSWISFDFNEIIIPMLDQEGGYKLVIEYRTPKISEISKFEKLFYVYRVNPNTNAEIAKSKTVPVTDKIVTKAAPVADKTATEATPLTEKTATKAAPVTDKTAPKTTPVTDKTSIKTTTKTIPATYNMTNEKKTVNDKQKDLPDIKIKEEVTPKNPSPYGNITSNQTNKPIAVEKSIKTDYDKLLAEAIEKKDATLFNESIRNGAGTNIKRENGGNIFHIMNDSIASEELISMLKNKGISINETNNYGNSPLHFAILSGESGYARSLINQGADLNMKNQMDLSPLHLAVFFNNEEVVNALLDKGTEINLKGNTGYTALHIASELNHLEIAKDLLNMGASNRIKTDQKLTPGTIARIQNNHEMDKLIGKKGSYTISQPKSTQTNSIILSNSFKQSPKFNFNLPYDKELAKKRQFNKVVQRISIPLMVISAAGATYLKIEANNYYSLYRSSPTEDVAKFNYDKTRQYDTYAYISGGFSLVSVYGFIHSTIRKKNVSYKMCRTYY